MTPISRTIAEEPWSRYSKSLLARLRTFTTVQENPTIECSRSYNNYLGISKKSATKIQIGESVVLLTVLSMIETRKFTPRGSRLTAVPAKTRQTLCSHGGNPCGATRLSRSNWPLLVQRTIARREPHRFTLRLATTLEQWPWLHRGLTATWINNPGELPGDSLLSGSIFQQKSSTDLS